MAQGAARKLLQALRDDAQNPRRQLDAGRRKAAIHVMRANTPVSRLVSRHTRELLRRYFAEGKIKTRIATRDVDDVFVELSPAEAKAYAAVENYISTTYDNAAAKDRNAVGFVMTIYRRRLASSFAALSHTLSGRLGAVQGGPRRPPLAVSEEDLPDDETRDEAMEPDEATQLERQSLAAEETADLEKLLRDVKRLPLDTKARELVKKLRELAGAGYAQTIVFTQELSRNEPVALGPAALGELGP